MAYMGRIWGSAIVLVKTLTRRVMIHVKHLSQHLVRNRCSNNVSSPLVPFDHPESLILCSPSQSLLWWSFLWSEVQWVQWVISILFLQKFRVHVKFRIPINYLVVGQTSVSLNIIRGPCSSVCYALFDLSFDSLNHTDPWDHHHCWIMN